RVRRRRGRTAAIPTATMAAPIPRVTSVEAPVLGSPPLELVEDAPPAAEAAASAAVGTALTFGPNSITGGDWGADDDTSAPHTASEPVPAAPTPLPHTTTGTTGVTEPPSCAVVPCCSKQSAIVPVPRMPAPFPQTPACTTPPTPDWLEPPSASPCWPKQSAMVPVPRTPAPLPHAAACTIGDTPNTSEALLSSPC